MINPKENGEEYNELFSISLWVDDYFGPTCKCKCKSFKWHNMRGGFNTIDNLQPILPGFWSIAQPYMLWRCTKCIATSKHHYNTQVFVWMFRKCCKSISNYTRKTKTASPNLQSRSSCSSWPHCGLQHVISLSLSVKGVTNLEYIWKNIFF